MKLQFQNVTFFITNTQSQSIIHTLKNSETRKKWHFELKHIRPSEGHGKFAVFVVFGDCGYCCRAFGHSGVKSRETRKSRESQDSVRSPLIGFLASFSIPTIRRAKINFEADWIRGHCCPSYGEGTRRTYIHIWETVCF